MAHSIPTSYSIAFLSRRLLIVDSVSQRRMRSHPCCMLHAACCVRRVSHHLVDRLKNGEEIFHFCFYFLRVRTVAHRCAELNVRKNARVCSRRFVRPCALVRACARGCSYAVRFQFIMSSEFSSADSLAPAQQKPAHAHVLTVVRKADRHKPPTHAHARQTSRADSCTRDVCRAPLRH
jgi:hypothetical protein